MLVQYDPATQSLVRDKRGRCVPCKPGQLGEILGVLDNQTWSKAAAAAAPGGAASDAAAAVARREDDGAHARLLLVAGDADAVRGRLQHAWAPQERLRNHRGRDDLPLPLWRRACQARDGVPSAGSYAACRR